MVNQWLFRILVIILMVPLLVRANNDHLLPKPQQYTLSSQSFKLDKVKVLSPVLQNDWKDFIAEMGGGY